MIEKEYKVFELKNGKKEITILFKNVKNPEVLSSFFFSDVIPFEKWIKEDFDKVLSGESKYEEVNGNVCAVEISPDITKVYNNLIEDDEEYYATCCEVGTKEVRQLLEEWCDAVREFKKNTSENMSSDGK